MFRSGLAPSHEPAVVISDKQTAYDVVQPLPERGREALMVAFRHAATGRAIPFIDTAQQPEPAVRWKSARIAIKTKEKILLVDSAEILAVESDGNYVVLRRNSGSYRLREQISVVADKLQPYGFIRIHRSILVSAAHVEMIEPVFTGEYLLRMKGGRIYNATRTYRKQLQLLAELWLGMEGFE